MQGNMGDTYEASQQASSKPLAFCFQHRSAHSFDGATVGFGTEFLRRSSFYLSLFHVSSQALLFWRSQKSVVANDAAWGRSVLVSELCIVVVMMFAMCC
jgi:hypothetical protein